MTSSQETLERIHTALEAAREVLSRFTPGAIAAEYKSGLDPVTAADRAVDAVLRKSLLREDEGWLSEESVDDFARLGKQRVWVVDPLDGTREFVQGIAWLLLAAESLPQARQAMEAELPKISPSQMASAQKLKASLVHRQ